MSNTPVNFAFDASQVEPARPLTTVPPGWYTVSLTESELQPTKAGQRVALVYTVMDGEHVGRKIFDGLNVVNENPTAVDIAKKTLSAICRATGVLQMQSFQQLHGIPFKINVGVRAGGKDDQGNEYDPQNKIKEYARMDGQPLAAAAGVAAPGAMPWAGGAGAGGPGAGFPTGAGGGGFPGPVAPGAAPTFGAIPGPAAPAAAAAPLYQMTGTAGNFSREQMHASGWSDEQLIQAGHMRVMQPAAPAAPAAPPGPPAAPAAPPAPGGFPAPAAPAAAAAGGAAPPWAR